jgi:hypothetical protein
MDWIDLAQDVDKWWVYVNTEYTFGFNKYRGIPSVAEDPLAYKEGLHFL